MTEQAKTNGNQLAFMHGTGTAGLKKRELFALIAMQGIISNQLLYMSAVHTAEKSDDITKAVAYAAVTQADALLEALTKTE